MEKKSKLRAVKIVGVVAFNLVCLFSIIYVITMTVEKQQAIGADTEVKVIKDFEGTKKMPQQQAQPAVGARFIEPVSGSDKSDSYKIAQPALAQPTKDMFLVDDFTGEEVRNKIGSRANVYVRPPSRVMISKKDDVINGAKKKALMIRYDKKNSGGPNGMGGWCGYYTLIKNEKTGQYLDGTTYKYITFWVKGEKGDEDFMVGLADEHWDKIGDSLKSEEIGTYLEKKKITAEWQKAKVPLDTFFLDHAALSSISINFEADCFPEGAGSGVVFIADIALEK